MLSLMSRRKWEIKKLSRRGRFFRNVCICLPNYTASDCRRETSDSSEKLVPITKLNDVPSQKAIIIMFTAVRTPDLKYVLLLEMEAGSASETA